MKNWKKLLFAILDAAFINVAFIMALLVRFEFDASGEQFATYLEVYLGSAVILTACGLIVFALFGFYGRRSMASISGLLRICLGCILAGGAALACMTLLQRSLPRSTYVIAALLLMALAGCAHLLAGFAKQTPDAEAETLSPSDPAGEEDAAEREFVQTNVRELTAALEGRIVLITGGAGQLGSELCRQAARFKPRRLIIVDADENAVARLAETLGAEFPRQEFDFIVASVCSVSRMEEVFDLFRPHVVFHAAAHRNSALMQASPREALVNNALGAVNVMELADRFLADTFVLLSSAGAAEAKDILSAAARISEIYLREKASAGGKTVFSAVRIASPGPRPLSAAAVPAEAAQKGGDQAVAAETARMILLAAAMARNGELLQCGADGTLSEADAGAAVPPQRKELFTGSRLAEGIASLAGKDKEEIRAWLQNILPDYQGV